MTNTKASSPLSHAAPRNRALAVLAIVAAIGLSGCSVFSATRHEIVGSVPDDYRTRHPIVLTDALAVLDVPATRSMLRLPADSQANVAAFGQKFVTSGAPAIAIVTPRGSANQAAAQRIAGEVKSILAASGVPPQTIDLRSYPALPRDTEAPVRIAYSRIVARTDQCGEWPDQLADTSQNRNYENFGCSTQQNLAVIVANPMDLAYPRGSTPPDATRRAGVLDKYRKGEIRKTDYGLESGSQTGAGP